MTTFSLAAESCTTCASQSESSEPLASSGNPITYNDGQGRRDRVVMSGPLSEVLAAQMNVIFQKKDLTADQESPDMGEPAVAAESHAQDTAVAEAFRQAAMQRDNQVVLSHYDVVSIKEHVKRMSSGKAEHGDQSHLTTIPVVVASVDDLTADFNISNISLKSTDELLIVTAPITGDTTGKSRNLFVYAGDNKISKSLHGPEITRPVAVDPTAPSAVDKAAALERHYSALGHKVHVGVQAFITSLKTRAG